MKNIVWYCSNGQKINKQFCETEIERQLFSKYADDIICKVKGETDIFFREVDTLQKRLQFTMEELDENGNLAFLDMNIKVKSCKEIN